MRLRYHERLMKDLESHVAWEEQPEFKRAALFDSESLSVADVRCRGQCRHKSAEECTLAAQLIFPYRGAFVRHVDGEAVVADPNQVLFFAADDVHRISHPIPGGDACMVITLSPSTLEELAQTSHTADANPRRRTLDAGAQSLRAVLLSRLAGGDATQVEAESLALALVTKTMAPPRIPRRRATRPKFALVDRVKLLLASSAAQRLTLGEIGRAVGASPVYLTQVFSDLEGLPLYRYQLRLRLAQALARLPGQTDLAALALDLGFSSHSQFTTLFRQTYGLPPADFIRATKRSDVDALLKILKAGPAWT